MLNAGVSERAASISVGNLEWEHSWVKAKLEENTDFTTGLNTEGNCLLLSSAK